MTGVVINTVQGIGDLFWIYQKVSPYVDSMVINVLCRDPNNAIQRRSEAFCGMLQKVGRVRFVKAAHAEYMRIARGRFRINDVIHARRPVNYAVNAPLEAGINLRDIDAGSRVAEFVDLGMPACVERDEYLCLYVAGAKSVNVWTPQRWADVATKLTRRIDARAIHLIGAEWDRPVQDEIGALLRRHFKVEQRVGANLAESIDIIRRARYFLGYQSGLNVLAENYDVPQLMIYFDKLAPMLYTWCKRASVRTTFHATTFGSNNLDALIEELPIDAIQQAA